MEIYSSRTASVGFLFVISLVLYWFTLSPSVFIEKTISFLSGTPDNSISVLLAIIGALVSLPVVGKSLEYVASFLAEMLRGRADSFPRMVDFGAQARAHLGFDETADPRAVYHLVFYEKCDETIREWGHRRRNRMYSSSANSLAALLGFLVGYVTIGQFSVTALAILIVFMSLNLRTFYFERRYHDSLINAWWSRYLSEVANGDKPPQQQA